MKDFIVIPSVLRTKNDKINQPIIMNMRFRIFLKLNEGGDLIERAKPAQVLSQAQWRMLKAKNEAADELRKKPLKQIPPVVSTLGPKVEYYIEMWKTGRQVNDIEGQTFSTANIRRTLSLILKADYSVLYLRRIHDNRVIFDFR